MRATRCPDWYPGYLRSNHGTTMTGTTVKPCVPTNLWFRRDLIFHGVLIPLIVDVLGRIQSTVNPTKMTKTTAFGAQIDYNDPYLENLSESEKKLYIDALDEVEGCLIIVDSILDGRTDEDGDIIEPLSTQEVGTLLEEGPKIERSLALIRKLRRSK